MLANRFWPGVKSMSAWKVGFLLLYALAIWPTGSEYLADEEGDVFTNKFVVEFRNEADEAVVQLIAEALGINSLRKVRGFEHVYLFEEPRIVKRSTAAVHHDYIRSFQDDPHVEWIEQLRLVHRVKRALPDSLIDQSGMRKIEASDRLMFTDPDFEEQWYLSNDGSRQGLPGYDMNVVPVWRQVYTGRGVVVCIIDDGVDHSHPDLRKNYNAEASFDLNDPDDAEHDPQPTDDDYNGHGTRCAGVVAAAANNSLCGVGIAYNVNIGGIRLLDGEVTDVLEAQALLYHNHYIDIYSVSWGPRDDGRTVDGPGRLAVEALRRGTREGRNGKGSIFVWAVGNGGVRDNCNVDGYVSSIYTLAVSSVTATGAVPYYAEPCAATLAVVFTGGSRVRKSKEEKDAEEEEEVTVITTDINHKCTKRFQGTSGAAPLAAGVVALLLEFNPNLSWRDVQHLIVVSSRIPSPHDSGWWLNGAGRHVHLQMGFGVMDAARLLEEAKFWEPVPEQQQCSFTHYLKGERTLVGKGSVEFTVNGNGCDIKQLEHIVVVISINSTRRGSLQIGLASPSGMLSLLLTRRPRDTSTLGLASWSMSSVHFWGEDPRGKWTLSVSTEGGALDDDWTEVSGFTLKLYGTSSTIKRAAAEFDGVAVNVSKGLARSLLPREVETIFSHEFRRKMPKTSSKGHCESDCANATDSSGLAIEDFLNEILDASKAKGEPVGGSEENVNGGACSLAVSEGKSEVTYRKCKEGVLMLSRQLCPKRNCGISNEL